MERFIDWLVMKMQHFDSAFLLPAFLSIFASGIMIVGGPNLDKWAVPRAIVFCGVVIGLVMALTRMPRDDE